MAERISLSAMCGSEGHCGSCHFVSVLRLPASDLGYGGHDFPGHSEAAGHVVPSDVVWQRSCHALARCDKSEERDQRSWVAACARLSQLRDGVDVAA